VAALLYLLVTCAILLVWHRGVAPVARGAAVVVIVLPLLFTGPALLTDSAYGGFDLLFLSYPFRDYAPEYGFEKAHNWVLVDQALQLAPWQREVRRALGRGEWPLWNPGMLSGHVLAGAMQAAPYDPVNLIALLLPQASATAFSGSMTLFFAAFFVYAFARELGLGTGSALVASAVFTCSGGIVFFSGWPLARSWSLLPLALLAVRRVVHARDVRAFALLVIALVLIIFAGHPETVLHIAALGVAYGIFSLAQFPIRTWGVPIAIAVAAGAVALLVTAVSLLPFLSLMEHSWEYRLRQSQTPAQWKEVWRVFRGTFLPYYGGSSWHTTTGHWDFGLARVGSVAFALAAVAAIRFTRRKELLFLAVVGALALLPNWKMPFVTRALNHVPMFELALNERLGFFSALVLALLAAAACEHLPDLRRDRWIVAAVAIALGSATFALWNYQIREGVDRRLIIAGAVAEAFGIAVLLLAQSVTSRRIALGLVLAVIPLQRVAEDGNIYPAIPQRAFYPSVPLVDAIPRDPMYRVTATTDRLIPNVASMYGLEDVRGYEAVTFFPYVQTMPLWCPDAIRNYHDIKDLSRPFLNFLGVRHAITPRDQDPPPGWSVVADDRSSRLIENSAAVPRVFVPRAVRILQDTDQAIREMADERDFAGTSWIITAEEPANFTANGPAFVNAVRKGTSYRIDVDARTAARVVITEAAWPGWRARIDGQPAKIERANAAFLAVPVPQGHHILELEYRPRSFVIGRAISLATLAALALLAVALRFIATPRFTSSRPGPVSSV
jgi:hypothetical protein